MPNTDPETVQQYWQEAIEGMNEQFSEAVQRNADAQAEFVEAWLEALGDGADEEHVEGAIEGYKRAYEIWMEAAEETVDRTADSLEGEDVSPEEIRDTWLSAANDSFSEIMGTAAFASVTGQTVGDALDMRQQLDELSEETLHDLGMATKGDVQEVGERLVELERRQHAVEEKLDRVLDHLEE
ncbi:MAG: poly(R)-hydroxyalkanoic acid synthase subunit PhaE [Halobacteriales archaeon]